MPSFALPTGSFVGAGRDSVASLKAVVTQIVGLDQVVLSFEAPVSVGIAPGQAVSCAGASRTVAKFCGGRNSVYSQSSCCACEKEDERVVGCGQTPLWCQRC